MTATADRVRLRPATESDFPSLDVFMRQLREDDPEEGDYRADRCEPAIRRLLANPVFGRVWMIDVVGEVSGYVVLTLGFSVEFGGIAAVVDELFVSRGGRGKGVGTRVLELVIDESRRLGVAVLTLEVTRSNDAAKRVYAKVGFEDRAHHLMTLVLA